MILGLDTASRLIGYCFGDGATVPEAGAWAFDHVGADLGRLADAFDVRLAGVVEQFGIRTIVYEAPILMRHDTLTKLRKLYGLGWHVEWFCARRGIACYEATVKTVKKELAGTADASKADMVTAASRCGVRLPRTIEAGRQDAADAFGVWLLGVRHHAPRTVASTWDQRLYGRRAGVLL